jgi:glycine cleavage system aminomethyltransferase T/glycine/D-amino acid oxidase-like deaminating enzyme
MSSPLPTETKVVIVGGGIVGCSLAYHLTKLGWKDVLLLEQNQLAGGTTWHAAGLVGRLRTSNSLTKINKYSAELYAGLEKETGHNVGWKQVGSLIVAKSQNRMVQLRRTAAMSEWFGVEVQMISGEEAKAKWPLLRIDDVLGAAWLPHDGKVIPKEVAVALAKGAQSRGAQLIEGVRVLGELQRDGRAIGVQLTTEKSETQNPKSEIIRAEYVVLTGGMWTHELGLRCGVTIPLYPVEHHYVVTEPIDGAFDELPVGRDPDLCLYFRGEGNAVMLGAFQAESKAWMVERVPDNFSFQLLEPDWERYSEPLKHGKWRIPALGTCKFEKFVNGPESFTPDNNFIMGEAPELKNLFVAAGFNSVGIASAGGAGKYLAEWMIEGQPTLDLWSVDIRRFGSWANNRAFLRERVTEVLGLHYQLAWPNREFETGRDLRKTPLHDRLVAAGACFGVKNGWERPNWFALDASTLQRFNASTKAAPPPHVGGFAKEPRVEYSFGPQNWFANHAFEHRATRETVAIFDQTGFGKLIVQGRDAVSVLQRLCGNNVDVPVGKVVYTGLFNERGGFESDLTVVRVAREEFYLITGTAQPVRDADWIRRHIRPPEHAEVADVSNVFGVLGVMGPNSRALLSRVTDADLSNEAFPFATAQTISVGHTTVRAVRITYVGELGWELHVPMDQLVLVYETLMDAGKDLGVINAGHYAINSLRLEKGYRAWGADLSPDDTPLEAGLAFAIDWNKEFIGREALLKQKQAGLKRQLVIFVMQDRAHVLWGSELIYRDGVPVGYTTCGSYGHTVGAAIAMGYVNNANGMSAEFIKTGHYEININGTRVPATPHLRAPYDPERKRILA